MTIEELLEIGFKEIHNPFTENETMFVLGEEKAGTHGNLCMLPIIYYDIKSFQCKTIRGEFCVIARKCETVEEIIKFVEAVNFLFELNVSLNNQEEGICFLTWPDDNMHEIISTEIKDRYNKIKHRIPPPL